MIRRVSLFAVVAVGLVSSSFAQTPAATPAPAQEAPKVDRSGEAKLKEVLGSFSKLGSGRMEVARYIKDGEAITRDASAIFTWKGSDFRYDYASLWGTALLAVGNTDGVYQDSMTSQKPIVVDPIKSIDDLGGVTNLGTRLIAPVLLVISPEKLDKLAVASAPITLATTGDTVVIEFKHSRVGVIRLTLKSAKLQLVETYPDFKSTAIPTTRDLIRFTSDPKVDSNTFKYVAPTHLQLDDRRTKKANA